MFEALRSLPERYLRRPNILRSTHKGEAISRVRRIYLQPIKEDGIFKPKEESEAMYNNKSITPEKEVITYCRIGERSSHTWFVLKYLLGYPNVKNYDGLWTERGNMVANPLVVAVLISTTTTTTVTNYFTFLTMMCNKFPSGLVSSIDCPLSSDHLIISRSAVLSSDTM